MVKWFKELFGVATVYKIVEVEKPRDLSKVDPEAKKTITSLAAHPGFVFLVAKLKTQGYLLETQLKNNRQDSLRDVEFLQSGIYWTNWLKQQVDKEVYGVKESNVQEASKTEQDAFEELQSALEMIK